GGPFVLGPEVILIAQDPLQPLGEAARRGRERQAEADVGVSGARLDREGLVKGQLRRRQRRTADDRQTAGVGGGEALDPFRRELVVVALEALGAFRDQLRDVADEMAKPAAAADPQVRRIYRLEEQRAIVPRPRAGRGAGGDA